jgi:hypothetical protein
MYTTAPEVETLARKLINTVDRHEHLADVRVDFIFINEAPASKGRLVLGRARKVGGLTAYLASADATAEPNLDGFAPRAPFFVIEISFDTWQGLTEAQRVALVDHELCHCRVDFDDKTGEQKLSTVGHDVEEFACVVERHGLWSNGLTGMGRVMSEQLALAIDHLETAGQ